MYAANKVLAPPQSLQAAAVTRVTGAVGLNGARNGGQVRPEHSFVNCMDTADHQIAAPGRPGPSRSRHTLAAPRPQPKATLLGSAAQPGRAGPGRPRKVWGVVHGVHWIQFCIANANLHALRAGRNAPPFPCDACGSTRSGRPDASLCDQDPHVTQAANPRKLRTASGSRATG